MYIAQCGFKVNIVEYLLVKMPDCKAF
uniref:Uncharacterized protein n=1 Tax=Anguilla anguilla TaxID=7936 RepID=A0A0E9V7U2_ANGAN